jgi:hypothetical protein
MCNGVVIEKKNIFVNMNSKNSIILVDPDFDVSSAENCDLLIKVTADNFSYAVINGSDNRLVVLYDHQECENVVASLTTILTEDNHLAIPFRNVKASVYTANTIAIPNDLFDSGQLNSYAKFFGEAKSEQLHLQTLKGQPFTSIFNLDHDMEELLITRFGISKVYDHTAGLLASGQDFEGKRLTLDFTVGSFTAVLTEKAEMVFGNCYEIADAEEFQYYLLLMIKQLNIDTAATKVYLSGIIHSDDTKFQAIEKYFSEVAFNIPDNGQLPNIILEDMPNHYYSNLLALQLCE